MEATLKRQAWVYSRSLGVHLASIEVKSEGSKAISWEKGKCLLRACRVSASMKGIHNNVPKYNCHIAKHEWSSVFGYNESVTLDASWWEICKKAGCWFLVDVNKYACFRSFSSSFARMLTQTSTRFFSIASTKLFTKIPAKKLHPL